MVVTSQVVQGVGVATTEEMAAKAIPAATARDLNENIILEKCKRGRVRNCERTARSLKLRTKN